MKKPIEKILPNPHRNFDIYPIGEAQVEALQDSIHEVGMFLGLPARKVKDGYEIACGHHRLEACKRVGINVIDLAVQDYTDAEMLQIMIRENATQRGNENFGAVLDATQAVMVQIVKDTYGLGENSPPVHKNGKMPIENLENGYGVGYKLIIEKEPTLTEHQVKPALSTFKQTGIYLDLLKKGGLPQEFWHLYEQKATTTIDLIAGLEKPSQAAAWLKGVDDPVLQERMDFEGQKEYLKHLKGDQPTITAKRIESGLFSVAKRNFGKLDPKYQPPEERTSYDKCMDIMIGIKSLERKIERLSEEPKLEDCQIEDAQYFLSLLRERLDWFESIQNNKIINI